jgi:hypothetical protein
LCELVKTIDGFSEGTGMLDVFPCQSGQASYVVSVMYIYSFPGRNMYALQSGVIGVLTGFTRICSRCSWHCLSVMCLLSPP